MCKGDWSVMSRQTAFAAYHIIASERRVVQALEPQAGWRMRPDWQERAGGAMEDDAAVLDRVWGGAYQAWVYLQGRLIALECCWDHPFLDQGTGHIVVRVCEVRFQPEGRLHRNEPRISQACRSQI